jgi:hypothetical protein
MAAPANAPTSSVFEPSAGFDAGATPALLAAMLKAHEHVSDLIFSPGSQYKLPDSGLSAPMTPGASLLISSATTSKPSTFCGNKAPATFLMACQDWPAFGSTPLSSEEVAPWSCA